MSSAVFKAMTVIVVMSEVTLPLDEIKKRLSEIVDGVESRHDRVVRTRNGRPAAVILSNPAAVREIRKAETEIDKGRALTGDELRAKYLAR